MLLSLSLRIAEGIAHAEGDSVKRHFDSLVIGEIIAETHTFNLQVASLRASCHTHQTKSEFVIQQRFRYIGSQQVKSSTPPLKGIAFR